MTSENWITDRPPSNLDIDFKGLIRIPKFEGDLSKGIAVSHTHYVDGTPWRRTHSTRLPKQKQSPNAKICATCCYWQKWHKPGGSCQRNAPSAVVVNADTDHSEYFCVWPGTDDDDWCGEWEAIQ